MMFRCMDKILLMDELEYKKLHPLPRPISVLNGSLSNNASALRFFHCVYEPIAHFNNALALCQVELRHP